MKKKLLIALLWLLLWAGLDILIDNSILFAGPGATFSALLRMAARGEFWLSISNSLLRILGGCLTGGVFGLLFAVLAFRLPFLREFLAPFVAAVKAAPVVSFVILILIWAGNKRLSFFVCAIIVFPILYLNAQAGIAAADEKLLEMAAVYRMPAWQRWRYVIWPAMRPNLLGAVSVAAGMGMKGGVSAEVIGQPLHSIGNSLYRAKIVLSTDEVFAWTLVIILLSALLGRIISVWLERVKRK